MMIAINRTLTWIFPQILEELIGSDIHEDKLKVGKVKGGTGSQTFGYFSELIQIENVWFLRTKVDAIVPIFLLIVFGMAAFISVMVGWEFILLLGALFLIFLFIPRGACRFTHEAHAYNLGLR